MLAVSVESPYGGIRKLFPSMPLMTGCLVGAYCEGGVKEQHALFCPTRKVAARRHRLVEIVTDFLEDVLQRRREGYAVVDRETQSVSLSRLMIGVLSDDDHLHPVKRTEVEGIEYERSGRITGVVQILLAHKTGEVKEVLLVELTAYVAAPRLFNLYVHRDE